MRTGMLHCIYIDCSLLNLKKGEIMGEINESYLWCKYEKLEKKYNTVNINNLDQRSLDIIKRIYWECEGIISALCWFNEVDEQISNQIDEYISLFEELKAKAEEIFFMNQDAFDSEELYERICG